MLNLTDDQKRECEKTINKMLDYWWDKIQIKMESISFEAALAEIKEEILND